MSTIANRLRELANTLTSLNVHRSKESLAAIATELEAAPAAGAVQPAQGMPDAGHPLLQRLVNSIAVEDGLPWWNYSDMYAVRDALTAIAALQADLAHAHRAADEASRDAMARIAELQTKLNAWISAATETGTLLPDAAGMPRATVSTVLFQSQIAALKAGSVSEPPAPAPSQPTST